MPATIVIDLDEEELADASPIDTMHCQICFENLDSLTLDQRQGHYETHLSGDSPSASDSTSPKRRRSTQHSPEQNSASASQPKGKEKEKQELKEEKETFWYPAQQTPPPKNYTPGLITVLRRALTSSHEKGNTRRAVLCYERTVHVARIGWDIMWGCGYRNFLMICTALMDQPFQQMYFPLLDHPIPPGVRNLQRIIQDAWKDGYDVDGAEDLSWTLVGTNKWVGTAELYVALTSRRIPAMLYDFNMKANPRGVELLIDWIVRYFSPPESMSGRPSTVPDVLRGASAVTITDKMPLVLQHKGHSRTIIGYEVTKTGTVNLLAFDPSTRPDKTLRTASLAIFNSINTQGLPSTSSRPTNAQQPPPPSLGAQHDNQASSKRKRNFYFGSSSSPTKARRVDPQPEAHNNDKVIVISDSEDDANPVSSKTMVNDYRAETGPNLASTLKFFRVNPTSLARRAQYQILCLTLEAPLSDEEQKKRRVVTSVQIC